MFAPDVIEGLVTFLLYYTRHVILVNERSNCTKDGIEFTEGLAWKGVLLRFPRRT